MNNEESMSDFTVDATPMDRTELKACFHCGKGMMHAGSIHFYEMTFRQCVVDMRSVQQQAGLEMMMGAAAPLAAALAPSTRVAYRLPAQRHLICAECAIKNHTILYCEGRE